MERLEIKEFEKELGTAREAFKGKREAGALTGASVKDVRFYHNSKTRHNACIFITESGETVYKEIKESDWLTVIATFTRAKELLVWYDENKMVQQFVLNHSY